MLTGFLPKLCINGEKTKNPIKPENPWIEAETNAINKYQIQNYFNIVNAKAWMNGCWLEFQA